MKALWELTHKEIINGVVALRYCRKCQGKGVYTDTVLQLDGERLIEAKQQMMCDCRERVGELLERANLPGNRYVDVTLGSLDWALIQPPQVCGLIRTYAERLDEMLANGIGLSLAGKVGTGKTHIAVGMIKLACGLGVEGRFFSMPELLGRLRATYNRDDDRINKSEEAILEELGRVPLLVLDDIDLGQPTDWMRSRLYRVISQRYNDQLATITTSCCGLGALAGRLGNGAVSRLVGTSVELDFVGGDNRARVKDRLLDEFGLGQDEMWMQM